MLPVALDILRGGFKLAECAAMAAGVTFVMMVVFGETDRVRMRRRARRAVKAYGLTLVHDSARDELASRRARRDRGRTA
jgi:hypothetical protein